VNAELETDAHSQKQMSKDDPKEAIQVHQEYVEHLQ
jgi:hypothetical protein